MCSIPECGKPVRCKGWCTTHYRRVRRHGDPLTVLSPRTTPPRGEFEHGTPQGYNHHGCRCDSCARWRYDYNATRRLRLDYGMTLEQFRERLIAQGGGCAICGGPPGGGRKKMHSVDHDHLTGRTRGILCHNCNAALGLFGDDPERLIAAAAYLRAHQGVHSDG